MVAGNRLIKNPHPTKIDDLVESPLARFRSWVRSPRTENQILTVIEACPELVEGDERDFLRMRQNWLIPFWFELAP